MSAFKSPASFQRRMTVGGLRGRQMGGGLFALGLVMLRLFTEHIPTLALILHSVTFGLRFLSNQHLHHQLTDVQNSLFGRVLAGVPVLPVFKLLISVLVLTENHHDHAL